MLTILQQIKHRVESEPFACFSETSPPETSSSSTPSSSSTSAATKKKDDSAKTKDDTAKTSDEFRLPDATVETEEQCKLVQFVTYHHNDYCISKTISSRLKSF